MFSKLCTKQNFDHPTSSRMSRIERIDARMFEIWGNLNRTGSPLLQILEYYYYKFLIVPSIQVD
jgi:hypothetical protein